MPIKRQNTRAKQKIRKEPANNRSILFIIVIVFFAMLIAGYFFFRGPSDTITNDSSKKAEGPDSVNEQAVPITTNDFQGAVAKAKFQLESVDNKDILKLIVEKTDGANDREITYTYGWSINGQPAGSGSDGISGFKRGDKVAVKVTPFDGEKPGKPRTLTLEIQNATPKVSESKEQKYDGKVFSYQVVASDPDGDTLSYELLKGPEGVTIDNKSGIISWPLKENNAGEYPIKVKIADGHGGEITYQLTATIPKESPPPVTVPKKSP